MGLKVYLWPEFTRALPIIMLTFFAGIVMDSVLIILGIFIFPAPYLPSWLILLWLSFALTLPRGFSFISLWHPVFHSVLGIAAGCLGYFAGYLMEAVSFGLSMAQSMLIIAILWAIFLPLIFWIRSKILLK